MGTTQALLHQSLGRETVHVVALPERHGVGSSFDAIRDRLLPDQIRYCDIQEHRKASESVNPWQNFQQGIAQLYNKAKYRNCETQLMWYAFNELEDRNFYSGERLRNRIETLDGPRVRLSTERDVKHSWVQWSCMYGANFRWSFPMKKIWEPSLCASLGQHTR